MSDFHGLASSTWVKSSDHPSSPADARAVRAGTMPTVSGVLSVDRQGEVAIVTLARPDVGNALSIELREELGTAFAKLGGDRAVGCIVLTGAGTAFCSGMDTTQFGGDRAHRKRLVETSTMAFDAVGGCRRPVVAAV